MSALPTRQERREFLESRQAGLGSSDIAAILGLDPWRTAFDVYISKTRPIPQDEETSVPQLRGILLEEPIAELYQEFSGRPVRQVGLMVHPEEDWARANADRMTVVDNDDQPCEIKAPGREKYAEVLESGMSESYIVQMHWEMWVVGHAVCSVPYGRATFVAGNLEHSRGPLLWYDLEGQPLLMEQLAERAHKFWHEHVLARVVPDVEEWGRPSHLEVPEHDGERHVVEEGPLADAARTLMKRHSLRKRATALYEVQRDVVRSIMDSEGYTRVAVPGVGKVNNTWVDGRTTFDDKRLREYGAIDPDKLIRWLAIQRAQDLLWPDLDPEAVAAELALDFSMFEKGGDAYQRFVPYPAKDRDE